MDHLSLIPDTKQSTVAQYVRKALAKKMLSAEKGRPSAEKSGGSSSVESATKGEEQKKQDTERFYSQLKQVAMDNYCMAGISE